MKVLAHYDSRSQDGEPLVEHLRLVAKRAREFAEAFSASNEAYVAGLLHDLGKYGEAFQRRLMGQLSGVDHWSSGAWQALQTYKESGVAIALAVQGHHIGLQKATQDSLRELDPAKLRTRCPPNLNLSCGTMEELSAEDINLPEEMDSIYRWGTNNAGSMLDVRMLFSALVDADFLETEAWFNRDQQGNRRYRLPALALEPDKVLSVLKEHVQGLANTKKSSPAMQELRNTVFAACLEAGKHPQGLFTLTAPTGSGKTLAMLAFALAHAARHNLRRIVTVLPYLTIVEQTAEVYREVLQRCLSQSDIGRYLLEDHSLSQARVNTKKADDDANLERLLSENWDAPIIVTTNVQFLESLFSNRPSVCRKLHRLARSVILFDEVQTLPLGLVIPTLGTLSRLVERYGSTVVFATATQPAFSHLHQHIVKHCALGWQPREILPDPPKLFSTAKRNKIVLPKSEVTRWDDIAERVACERQVLCVVNTKKQARLLFEKVKVKRSHNTFHLSTNMCPAHRKRTLDCVRSLLKEGKPCCLISTQCVEAGVDIDFPVVFRSLAPLDAIAQAAGRCNRNALLWDTGNVYVFRPEDENYPDAAYKQATGVAASLIIEGGAQELDPSELRLFERYYSELYSVRGFGSEDLPDDQLLIAVKIQDFVEVSRLYRIIPQDTINVLVPYDKEAYRKLAAEVRQNGLTYEWIIAARPHTVPLFRPTSSQDALSLCLEPICIKPGSPEKSDEWYIYRKEEDYDLETGLDPSLLSDTIIA